MTPTDSQLAAADHLGIGYDSSFGAWTVKLNGLTHLYGTLAEAVAAQEGGAA